MEGSVRILASSGGGWSAGFSEFENIWHHANDWLRWGNEIVHPLIMAYYLVIAVTRDYGAVQRDYGDRETTASTYRTRRIHHLQTSVRIHGESLTLSSITVTMCAIYFDDNCSAYCQQSAFMRFMIQNKVWRPMYTRMLLFHGLLSKVLSTALFIYHRIIWWYRKLLCSALFRSW